MVYRPVLCHVVYRTGDARSEGTGRRYPDLGALPGYSFFYIIRMVVRQNRPEMDYDGRNAAGRAGVSLYLYANV
ncbi:hypothetical protein D9M69_616550 [compost metagenome]